MTKDEALKLALAVLKEWRKGFPDDWTDFDTEAIIAIKEALAQPEQICGFDVVIDESMPPNTFKLSQPKQKRPENCGTGYCSCIECVMEPEQEPVATHNIKE